MSKAMSASAEKSISMPATKPKVDYTYQRDKDRQIVRGKFIFHEVPGGGISFNFKQYKEDQIERYDLHDGQIYSLPLGVARHLNKNGWYPIYEYMKDDNTQNVMRVGQKVRRFSFQSLEFVDEEDLLPIGKDIVTVETV